jgi:hypothetical protein
MVSVGKIRELRGWCYNHERMDFRENVCLVGGKITYITEKHSTANKQSRKKILLLIKDSKDYSFDIF